MLSVPYFGDIGVVLYVVRTLENFNDLKALVKLVQNLDSDYLFRSKSYSNENSRKSYGSRIRKTGEMVGLLEKKGRLWKLSHFGEKIQQSQNPEYDLACHIKKKCLLVIKYLQFLEKNKKENSKESISQFLVEHNIRKNTIIRTRGDIFKIVDWTIENCY